MLTSVYLRSHHSGMAPLIRAVLSNLIGEEDAAKIDIISNDVRLDEDGSWHIVYRHPERSVCSFPITSEQPI